MAFQIGNEVRKIAQLEGTITDNFCIDQVVTIENWQYDDTYTAKGEPTERHSHGLQQSISEENYELAYQLDKCPYCNGAVERDHHLDAYVCLECYRKIDDRTSRHPG